LSAEHSKVGHEEAEAELVSAMNAHSEAVVLFHSAVAQSMGLDATAYKTLFLLQRLGPMSASEIAREHGLATASVTNLIDRLLAKGFISRAADKIDRRRVIVSLNADNLKAARPGFGVPNPSLATLCERYDVAELRLITDFLTRNALRLRDDLAHERSV